MIFDNQCGDDWQADAEGRSQSHTAHLTSAQTPDGSRIFKSEDEGAKYYKR